MTFMVVEHVKHEHEHPTSVKLATYSATYSDFAQTSLQGQYGHAERGYGNHLDVQGQGHH